MSSDDCVEFLQWALPRAGLRWAGFRKVRRQVCRRVRARIAELGLHGFAGYREYLERHDDEWAAFTALTPVTISRFYRDRAVWEALEREILPGAERAWCAGCASGEEAYTLALLAPRLEILATDIHEPVLERARAACYPPSSLRELPERLRGFDIDALKPRVRIEPHDLRDPPPPGPFDVILCRNAAFTYFDDAGQRAVLANLTSVLRPGGALVVGLHEELPLEPWPGTRAIYRAAAQPSR